MSRNHLDFIPQDKSLLTPQAHEMLALEALQRARRTSYRDSTDRAELIAVAQVFATLAKR